MATAEKEKYERYWSRIETVVNERIGEKPDFYDNQTIGRIEGLINSGKIWKNENTFWKNLQKINELLHDPIKEVEWKDKRVIPKMTPETDDIEESEYCTCVKEYGVERGEWCLLCDKPVEYYH